uniref:Reverse transcriptase zinc-binding domain-containing protein n=1 Tax=Aegilops tauschii subsp. strangulata TaxID=200361 RepID=A0A453SA40_AEGTS
GRLGISNLEYHGAVLRTRWLWQQAKFPDKPWTGLPFPSDKLSYSIFIASTVITIGSGATISFWHSHWWQGTPLRELFPQLYSHSRGHNLSLMTALADRKWITCIKENPTAQVLADYVRVWNITAQVNLSPTQPDDIRWKWTADGQYSARTAYQMLFQGRIRTNHNMLIWSSRTPPKCQMHAWLAIQGRCNTADQLAKKNWPHTPTCTLCQLQPETALHLFAQCQYTRLLWQMILQRFHAQITPPRADEPSLEDWWYSSVRSLSKQERMKVNCLVICAWWHVW